MGLVTVDDFSYRIAHLFDYVPINEKCRACFQTNQSFDGPPILLLVANALCIFRVVRATDKCLSYALRLHAYHQQHSSHWLARQWAGKKHGGKAPTRYLSTKVSRLANQHPLIISDQLQPKFPAGAGERSSKCLHAAFAVPNHHAREAYDNFAQPLR